MSSLGLLSKAERTGNNISKYGFGREVGCPYFWSPWVDDLYSPDWHIKINTRYPWKERFLDYDMVRDPGDQVVRSVSYLAQKSYVQNSS